MRLNKIAKDLNVGIQTLIDFLQQKGGEDLNPMSNISDEQYALLCREFSQDKSAKQESDRLRTERQSGKEKLKDEKKQQAAALTEPHLAGPKVVGHIDLDAHKRPVQPAQPQKPAAPKAEAPKPAAPATPQPKPDTMTSEKKAEEPKAQPSAQGAATPAATTAAPTQHLPYGERSKSRMSEEPLPEAAKSGEVFRLNQTTGPTLNVVGTIDLDALNQSTRPRKKSKDEKRREREQKGGNGGQNGQNGGQNAAARGKDGKRQRINAQKVDINAVSGRDLQNNNNGGGKNGGKNNNNNNNAQNGGGKKNRLKKPMQKAEVSEEDVQKQVKETLARLMGKPDKRAVKYRKDKRTAAAERAAEMQEEEAAESKVLKLTEFVTANDLATMMNVSVTQVITTCMSIGIMVSINQRLDAETINLVAEEFGFTTEYVSNEVAQAIQEEEDKEEDLVTRPPIITVMGHVDHGKTKLLDYIRNTNVIAGEAGGITQHIGAYNVQLADGRHVTFLDTPGHEAFTAMRARGAKMTDIAIIIIAADDGIMPQTKEAINHAAAANVPIVFAINKIDKPTANPNKVKEQLSAMNYLVEEWGGKYQSQDISAREGLNVDLLLEKVLLEAEMLDLKANPNRRAVGSVIESTLDKGRGYVATVLVQNGTLHVGDVILAGTNFGRVKAMYNERNQKVQVAGPSTPVQVLGMSGAPQAGDQFNVLETEQEAREIATKRERLAREQSLRTQTMLTLDEIGRRIAVGNFQELNLIVKGDVDGSVEALSDSLIKLSTEQIQVNVIHKAVGQISESDVTLAAASKAIIVGFQVRPSQAARRMAEHDGVEIRLYSIIYDAIEEVKDAMEGMLAPETKEEIDGYLEVKTVFKITKVGTVAGCLVKEGKIKRTDKVRVIRDGIVLYAGELGSLKRFKDDVKEVGTNFECGLNINGFNDLQEGDLVEAYAETLVKKKL
jgi:translation initiation factor IF-2